MGYALKALHRNNLFCWSQFNEDRNIDFHSYLWVGEAGNVVFDPLPMTTHDKKHLNSLGSVSHIILSTSDHVRDAVNLAGETGADIWGPAGEQQDFPIQCSRWLSEAQALLEGLDVYAVNGSKTKGELFFIVDGVTLITGDLIRAHNGGKLCILPEAKLQDRNQAVESVRRLAAIEGIVAILPGDGWPVFRDGATVLTELIESLSV